MKEEPDNMVNGSDPYPPSTTGKTWDDAFNDRLTKNGLGPSGTPDTPAVGGIEGKKRIQDNRRKKIGCG